LARVFVYGLVDANESPWRSCSCTNIVWGIDSKHVGL